MEKSLNTIASAHSKRHRRSIPEDFVILVIHDDAKKREKWIKLMKEGDFSVYGDSGMKGAIGSALMFIPHVIIFDWDTESTVCGQAIDYLRNQKLAAHIAMTHVIVLATESAPHPENLAKLEEDPFFHTVRYIANENYDNKLKKHILRLFLEQRHKSTSAATPQSGLKYHRTVSMKDRLAEHKKFNETINKTIQVLAQSIGDGIPQQIFNEISQALDQLDRPFLLKYKGNLATYKYVFKGEQNVDKLEMLLTNTIDASGLGQITEAIYSDQDRRCFVGSQQKLFFATESPEVFDELGNFSVVTQNFENFLLQSEQRKLQLELFEDFSIVMDDLYVQVDNFELSESLEQIKALVSQMLSIEE